MANCDIGSISKEDFMKLLPDRVPVRKSLKENAKFPLYCHTPLLGPISINTRGGQEVILNHAVLYTPGDPEPIPEPIPERLPEPIKGDSEPELGMETGQEDGTWGKLIDTLGTFDE